MLDSGTRQPFKWRYAVERPRYARRATEAEESRAKRMASVRCQIGVKCHRLRPTRRWPVVVIVRCWAHY